MIFLERDLQGGALHGRVEFKVAGQGGLVAAAARTQASPQPPWCPVLRFTCNYSQRHFSSPTSPIHTHTLIRTHARTRTRIQAHITGLPQGRTRTSAPGPLLLPSPPVEGSPARFELCSRGHQAAKLL
jgi:hypothetical protein